MIVRPPPRREPSRLPRSRPTLSQKKPAAESASRRRALRIPVRDRPLSIPGSPGPTLSQERRPTLKLTPGSSRPIEVVRHCLAYGSGPFPN